MQCQSQQYMRNSAEAALCVVKTTQASASRINGYPFPVASTVRLPPVANAHFFGLAFFFATVFLTFLAALGLLAFFGLAFAFFGFFVFFGLFFLLLGPSMNLPLTCFNTPL